MTTNSLFDFQHIGVQFLNSAEGGRCALLDEMGLGKTVMTLRSIAESENPAPVLVVCPKALIPEWAKAVRDWLPSWKVYSAVETNERGWWLAKGAIGHRTIGLANYASLGKVLAHKRRLPSWSVLVVDEAHYVKNRKAERSRRVAELARKAERVYLLTGTPPLYHPEEMWHLLHILDPLKFRSYWQFFKRHVKYWSLPHRNAKIPVGTKDLDVYAEEISPYILRRKKADVLPDLPPLIISEVPAELTGERRRIYDAVLRGQMTDPQGDRVTFPNALAKITALRKVATAPVIALDENPGNVSNSARECAKINVLLEKALSIPTNEQFVVFTHFRRTKQLVAYALRNAGIFVADVDRLFEWEKLIAQALVDTFYKGGLGLNLQAASHAFFIEPPSSWTWYQQSLHRLQRPGSDLDSYHIWKLYSAGTVDEHLYQHLERLGERAEEADLAVAAWRSILEEYNANATKLGH